MVPTDEYEAGKVSLGVSLPVLSLSHVCVTHVGRPRAGGRAYVRAYRGWCMRAACLCMGMHEGTSEGTKEGRGGRAAMTTMGRWFSRGVACSLFTATR